MDEQNTPVEGMQGKDSYEAQKAERQGAKESARRGFDQKKGIQKIGMVVVLLAVVGVVGFGVVKLVGNLGAKGEDFSQPISVMRADHINIGSPLPEYTSNPPSSGPHYGQIARTGFREEEIPDQHIIHNLEHGDIWIAYHPRVSGDIQSQLKKLGGSKVVVTPRQTNDTDIALVAWGRLDSFDITNGVLDKQRIEDFIKRYINRGPERVGPSVGGI